MLSVPARTLRWSLVLATLAMLAGPGTLRAQDPTDPASPKVIRVEEDWLLWVVQPNGAIYSPQFHTVMSPLQDLDSYYFQITWNYRELPEFMPGGFQVQSWNGEDNLNLQNINNTELSRAAELITWTQVMETNGTQIAFSIINGLSSTWGAFGHPDTLLVHNGAIPDLNRYSPDVSVDNSWITFGQNRVYLLKVYAVRYYGEHGLLWEDTTNRVVYQYEQVDD
ncbi:MAG TPA: hypothetical protein PLQ89_14455 [Phycisphaerae bacterium]|nr:hypothetical protein [Phycisphaerae bacterium]HOJ74559.1 hypothetical protein [Phycisphaerae bacterium]HOM52760.1 hypothetical protein [Phycisphaerae bacterium]HOQ86911.1 hypothetical protein [Phycisphaerae bacterium]HPP28463.1 hypothetical protein [Phycisphaerae bacterium]